MVKISNQIKTLVEKLYYKKRPVNGKQDRRKIICVCKKDIFPQTLSAIFQGASLEENN